MLRIYSLAALLLAVITALAQAPASTPFPSWTAALQRAAAGGENARVAFVGDSNFDQPRAFYLPLRLAFEAQATGSPGANPGGAGVAALTGFQINDLEVFYNGLSGDAGKDVASWQRLDDDRGLADPTLVGTTVGDELAVVGARGPSRFDRATVYLDRVPGGGTAVVEFADGAGALLHGVDVDLDGPAELVTVTYDGYAYADGNRASVRVVDPRAAGVHVLGVNADRRPNNSVQVHKLGYFGFNAEDWAARLAGSAAQAFYGSLDLAIVSLGTNDMRRGDADAYDRHVTGMTAILAYFQAAGVPVIVTAVADMAPDELLLGSPRSFDEATARLTARDLAARYGAAYGDLGALHGDYAQIERDGVYRDVLHYLAYSLDDPAAQRHGPFFYNAIAGLPTADRSAGNAPAPAPDAIAPVDACGPVVLREVDGSRDPAVVYFRAPAPDHRILAGIRNDVDLGLVRVESYGAYEGHGRTSAGGLRYGPRQVAITPERNGAAVVLLPVTKAEIAAFDDAAVDSPDDLRWRRAPGARACGDYADDGAEEGLTGVVALGGGHLMSFRVGGFSTFYLAPASRSALPVELIDFSAVAKTHHTDLAWTTALEIDFAHFAVERSRDGARWVPLGKVLAKAAPGRGATYGYTDASPPPSTSYYRLVMHDVDGTVAYGHTRAVTHDLGRGNGFVILPNPPHADGTTTLRFASRQPGREIVVCDPTGRQLARLRAESKRVTLEVADWRPGVYAVGISGEPRATRRLVLR